jgi:hypothetical protein
LRQAVEMCELKVHVFGHIYEGWDAVRSTWDITSNTVGNDMASKRAPET